MYQPKIGSYAVYEPPEEGWQDWEQQSATLNRLLGDQGAEVIAAPEAVKDPASCKRVAEFFSGQSVDMLHALVVSWSFDHYTIEIQQKVQRPVNIRAIPGIRSGSIVGSQQLNCLLEDIEVPHRIHYGGLEDKAVTGKAVTFAKACAIQRKLFGSRIGVIGRRTEGMSPTAVDEIEILRLFGIRLLNYGMDELFDLAGCITQKDALAAWEDWVKGASKVVSKSDHGIQSARNYLALKRLIAEQGLDAITIGSYPKCQGTMCAPIAWLNEEGIPAGCEGDVNSTICMLILSILTDHPVHFGEMLALDEKENTIVSSHCGCGSPSLADDKGFILHPVRLANDGVCIRFTAKPGPVTYVNLVGRKGNYRMCALEGEAVKTGMVFEGNPLKFIIKTPLATVWRLVNDHGLGHHWMTGYAHISDELAEFCQLSGMEGVFPDLEGHEGGG